MIITLKTTATEAEVTKLRNELEAKGLVIHPVEGAHYNILGLIGDTASLDSRQIESLDFVDKVTRIQEPFKKANRKFHPEDSIINVGGALIGGGHFAVMAGPCSVETPEQVSRILHKHVKMQVLQSFVVALSNLVHPHTPSKAWALKV